MNNQRNTQYIQQQGNSNIPGFSQDPDGYSQSL